ncbi:WYL domain-containing protein, partial [bacterium]|nr:WYL domain-containing protein [bacterium]
RIQYQSGHWYLRAYRLFRRGASGEVDRQEVHLKYRLSYIQDDEKLDVSATVMPSPPEAEKYLVHYRLLPPLSRGVISEHFSDMTTETLDDGSIEIKGYCDDPWEAGRLLLTYGETINTSRNRVAPLYGLVCDVRSNYLHHTNQARHLPGGEHAGQGFAIIVLDIFLSKLKFN